MRKKPEALAAIRECLGEKAAPQTMLLGARRSLAFKKKELSNGLLNLTFLFSPQSFSQDQKMKSKCLERWVFCDNQ